MALTVSKPAKDFLEPCFEEWYAEQIIKQPEGQDIETAVLQPIDLGLPALKELGVKWMVEVTDYFGENPQTAINGFIKAGIVQALEDQGSQDSGGDSGTQLETDSEEYESDSDDDYNCEIVDIL